MSIVSDYAHGKCINWSRWCWQGEYPHPLPSTKCGSAESDFHAKWHLEMAPDEPPRIRPDARYAMIVQALWESWPVASPARQVLKAEYPGRDNSGRREGGREVAARRLHMTLRNYETALAWASGKVEEAFSREVA